MHWWERERDVGIATQWKWHIVCCNTYCKAECSWGGGALQLDNYGGKFITSSLINETCMHAVLSENPPFTLSSLLFLHPRVQKQRLCKAASIACWGYISLSHYGPAMLISSLRGQRACAWIDSQGQSSVRTQWTTTKELISNQLPTCFCPAPFIWLECRAGYHSPCPIHTHTHHLLPMYVCVQQMCVVFGEFWLLQGCMW